MHQSQSSRRTLLKSAAIVAGCAAANPLLSGSIAQAQAAEGAPAAAAVVGISTLGFPEYTNAELAAELAREGIKVVQLFLAQKDSKFWVYNGRSDVSPLTPERCKTIADAYRSAGIAIHSIGVYTNLIHPEAKERAANLAYFEAMMKIGAAMGVRCFITEAGHYHSKTAPEPAVPLHFQEATWKLMVETGKELARLAEANDATVLLEPFYRGFLASAKRMRLFLEDIGSKRVRALLDPANLLEINDLEEMFAQLGPYVDCLHAKDRKLHVDRGVAAGQGDLDYAKFVALARKHTPQAPFILEYVGAKDFKPAFLHLLGSAKM